MPILNLFNSVMNPVPLNAILQSITHTVGTFIQYNVRLKRMSSITRQEHLCATRHRLSRNGDTLIPIDQESTFVIGTNYLKRCIQGIQLCAHLFVV